MLRSEPTAPALRVGPCIKEASSSTTPSSFGRPPYPTELSFGSSSTMFTPATTASSVSLPAFSICMARAQAIIPFALATTMFFGRAPLWANAAAGSAPPANEESSQSLRRIMQCPSLVLRIGGRPCGHHRIGISPSYAIPRVERTPGAECLSPRCRLRKSALPGWVREKLERLRSRPPKASIPFHDAMDGLQKLSCFFASSLSQNGKSDEILSQLLNATEQIRKLKLQKY